MPSCLRLCFVLVPLLVALPAPAQNPIVVKPPTIEVPPPPPPSLVVTPPPPAPIQRPPVIVSCDAGGCWDSNGTRLNRAGPVLVGPGGPCLATGNVVQCP
jgi:hypothetical protein